VAFSFSERQTMSAPPARTALADTYPNPSNAVFRTGIGALWDYVTWLLGATGNAAEARTALGIGSAISFRNLLINGNFAINQRGYVSGTNTLSANQYTLDRWRVVTSGQNATFGAAGPDRTVTFPAGGGEQVIEGAAIVGGIYTLSWTGAATATVNGVAITNGGNTSSLAANTNVTVKFVGAVGQAQFELGTVATPFERRSPSVEMLMAKWYFRRLGPTGISSYAGTIGGTLQQSYCAFSMRVAPTVAINLTSNTNANGISLTLSADGAGYWQWSTPAAGASFFFMNNIDLTAEL
jgi:hypothetical protein